MALALLGVLLFGGEYTIPNSRLFRKLHRRCEGLPDRPDALHDHCLRRHFGLHATQSPLMARCMRNERESRSVFYGAMISEHHRPRLGRRCHGLFRRGACRGAELAQSATGGQAAVNIISNTTLGIAGRYSALLRRRGGPDHIGRHGLPFGTADRRRHLPHRTAHAVEAFRSPCRSSSPAPHHAGRFHRRVALFRMDQPDARHVVLWAVVVWLRREAQLFVALLPAVFMTFICASFVFVSASSSAWRTVRQPTCWAGA